MSRTCYGYNALTSVFEGLEIAYECQIDKGSFLLPAHATFVAPPSQSLTADQVYKWDGTTWKIQTVTVDENVGLEKTEEPSQKLRNIRNTLLRNTDHLFLRDRTMEPSAEEAWKIYRQQLRDLPANTIDPENPVWPVPPQN